MRDQKVTAVAPKAFGAVLTGNAVSAGRSDALGTAHTTAGKTAAFTLAELLVSIGVLVLLVFLATQLLNSAASITTLGHKQMDADAQARQVLDRMAIDFAQMVKRPDVDYYVKSSWFASGTLPPPPGVTAVRTLLQQGNDQIAFYSGVPGYYSRPTGQSPVSLVAYRVYNPSPAPSPCSDCNKLQRMGRGLLWNAAVPAETPIVFMPKPIASPIPVGELPSPAPNPTFAPVWPQAGNMDPDAAYEVVGSQVFRFEYYYLLQGRVAVGAVPSPVPSPSPPILSDIPWDYRICSCESPTPTATPTPTITPAALCCHTAPEGMQDVVAVVVDIAVIDPKSRVLVTDAQLARLNGADGQAQGPALTDWGNTSCVGCPTQTQWQTTPGLLLAQWRAALDANAVGLPRPAISGIRLYERYLYLSPPNLQTP
jgi:hypothetical protein